MASYLQNNLFFRKRSLYTRVQFLKLVVCIRYYLVLVYLFIIFQPSQTIHHVHTSKSSPIFHYQIPSLAGKGLLTTYLRTSSSGVSKKSLRILLARLGPRRFGTVVSVSPGISFSPALLNDFNFCKNCNQILKRSKCVFCIKPVLL